MEKILTVTLNPALDKSTEVDTVKTDRKLRCEPPKFEPGGGGINISRAIQLLGGQSTAFYTKGGATGDLYSTLLEEEGIQQKPIEIDGMTRENLVVFEQSKEELYRFGMPGAALEEKEWQKVLTTVEQQKNIDYVAASGSLPPGAPSDFYLKLAKSAKEIGARFVLDTSREPLKKAFKAPIFLLKPNLKELDGITGEKLEHIEDQEAAAQKIVAEHTIENLLLSLGASGALLVRKEGIQRFHAPSVPKKSTVGAGDSMLGAVLFGLANDYSFPDAVQLGIACGSAAIKTSGTALFKPEEAKKLHDYLKKQNG